MGGLMSDAMLHVLGDLIKKEIHVAPMLERLVDVMASQLQADRGTVFLLNESGNELVSVAAHLPEIKEIRVPLSQGVAGYVARTGKSVAIPSRERIPIWRDIDRQTGYHTQSMLAGPLYTNNHQLIGVVQLLNKKSGTFTPDDTAIFDALSQQASALLEQTTVGRVNNYLPKIDPDVAPHEVLGSELPLEDRFNGIIGSSPPMHRVLRKLRRVAPTHATVLLRGDTGTGKGLFARALHHNSNRQNGPLVHVDCTTLPEGLVESELFGHEQGAFTGATQRKQGKVEAAHGGTLFLDEIGDLALGLQGKLLTLLQEQSYYRLGSSVQQQADIRVIAATNRNLESQVQQGLFREDLYYRLRVVELHLPSLQERGQEDLLRLLNHFVDKAAQRHRKTIHRIEAEALSLLLSYPWPGNVRELENCLESAVIFADDSITADCVSLPPYHLLRKTSEAQVSGGVLKRTSRSEVSEETGTEESLETTSTQGLAQASSFHRENPSPVFSQQPTLAELEAQYISHLLAECRGNRSQCARILGIGRNTLLRKIKAYKLSAHG